MPEDYTNMVFSEEAKHMEKNVFYKTHKTKNENKGKQDKGAILTR